MCDHHFDARRLRHRWEMPLIWLSGGVSLVVLLLAGAVLSLDAAQMTALFADEAEAVADTAGDALLVLILPLALFLYRFYMAAKAKANAIRVGPEQLPQLWDMYQDLGRRMDMPRLPKLYVTNGNGVVNAYALSCNRRHKYIVLHAETVIEMKRDPSIVEFVLAHELAHHKLGHVSLWRLAIGLIPNVLVPLGKSASRAQEYSADRVALKLCGHHQGTMNLLAVGPWMVQDVNPEAWLEQCRHDRRELYVRAVNLMSGHAVMSKRYKALRDIEAGGFNQHGDMF